MFVTVKYQDQVGQEGRVIGIFESAEQAVRIVDADSTHRTDAFVWPPVSYRPEIGETVAIKNGELQPQRGMRLLDVLSRASRIHEVREVRAECEALKATNAAMKDKLTRPQKTFRDHLFRISENGQMRNLFIASNPNTALENLAADVAKKAELILHEFIVFAAKEETANKINHLVQENLYEQKLIEGHEGIAHGRSLYHVGDRVLFAESRSDVQAGDLGSVIHLDRTTRSLVVMLDRDASDTTQLARVSLAEHPDLRLGYATTFDRMPSSALYQAVVFCRSEQTSAPFVDTLHVPRIAIYADKLTAAREFPTLFSLREQPPSTSPNHDPLFHHIKER